MPCCGQQFKKTIKVGSNACFTCLGASQEHILEKGHKYPPCSPLVAGDLKTDAWRPMTDDSECIVAFVGPNCSIDATEWADDKPVHVYPEAVGIQQRICWPADEQGVSIFSQAQIKKIAHAHHCCVSFDKELPCQEAPAWLQGQETTNGTTRV